MQKIRAQFNVPDQVIMILSFLQAIKALSSSI